MRTILRRLRGIAGTTLLWAIAWGLAGGVGYAVAGAYRTLAGDHPLTLGEVFQFAPVGALFLAIYGALGGAAFAVVLAVVERRRMLQELSPRRIALWGALGGMGVLLMNGILLYLDSGIVPSDAVRALLITGVLGAGCAAGSLALARRGAMPGDPQHLLPASHDGALQDPGLYAGAAPQDRKSRPRPVDRR